MWNKGIGGVKRIPPKISSSTWKGKWQARNAQERGTDDGWCSGVVGDSSRGRGSGVKGRPKWKVSEKTRSTKNAENEGGVWWRVEWSSRYDWQGLAWLPSTSPLAETWHKPCNYDPISHPPPLTEVQPISNVTTLARGQAT
jgi:hypothetical protein